MKALLTKILNAIRSLFSGKKLFVVVWAGMKKDTNSALNNTQLQELAFDAAKAAAELGLKGAEARAEALARLKADLAAIGKELADRIIDTLLQIGYMRLRDLEG